MSVWQSDALGWLLPVTVMGVLPAGALWLWRREGRVFSDLGFRRLHERKADFLKGGLIGVIFAVLLGGAPWIVAGAAAGTAFALFDRGIKNKLLKELGEGMSVDESALAVLIKEADWAALKDRMAAKNFGGETIVNEMTDEHMAKVEELADDTEKFEVVPEEMEVPEATE